MADPILRLHSLPADPPAAPDAPLVADARRLARLLCVGLRTVRTWDAAGKLPAPARCGGKVLWIVADIRAWLAAGCPDRATWETRRAVPR